MRAKIAAATLLRCATAPGDDGNWVLNYRIFVHRHVPKPRHRLPRTELAFRRAFAPLECGPRRENLRNVCLSPRIQFPNRVGKRLPKLS